MRMFLGVLFAVAFLLSYYDLAAKQEPPAKAEKMTFHFRSVQNPADPDPVGQKIDDRLATLRSRIRDAKQLLDDDKHNEFFDQYLDPFWLARTAAGQKITVSQMMNGPLTDERRAATTDRFGKMLEASLKPEPQWLLDGRAASFMSGHSSHTAEFWIYFDGKWRISPET